MDWGQILSNTASAGSLSPATIAYALAAIGLAVHFGYAGLLNFGMAGFMALGAYGYAISILTLRLPVVGRHARRAVVAAAVFALILGIPTLRLRADYLAIVTIAAAEIVRLLFTTQLVRRVHRTRPTASAATTPASARANPFPDRARTASARGRTTRPSWWVRVFGLDRCSRSRCCSSGRSCAAPGAACSRASARTRTPCARSARTSSPTRCRRSSSVASSARSAASSSSCPRRSSRRATRRR